MEIRKYRQSDCREVTELFYNTVHTVNAKDYTKEELDVWATGREDLKKWNQILQDHFTVVAVDRKIITGFGDIDRTGYLDHLFVHRDHQGADGFFAGRYDPSYVLRANRKPFLRPGVYAA